MLFGELMKFAPTHSALSLFLAFGSAKLSPSVGASRRPQSMPRPITAQTSAARTESRKVFCGVRNEDCCCCQPLLGQQNSCYQTECCKECCSPTCTPIGLLASILLFPVGCICCLKRDCEMCGFEFNKVPPPPVVMGRKKVLGLF